MKQTPAQMLIEVEEALTKIHWNYSFNPHGSFFPGDVRPHSRHFKYVCKKLYEAGMLEGMNCGRWGWNYRVPEKAIK